MAGTLVISTLSDGTNSTSSTNCIQGSAKAWVNFNGTVATPTIRASYNVSSVTKGGTGNFTINFTSALADANYAYSANRDGYTSWNSAYLVIPFTTDVKTTTQFQVHTGYVDNGGLALNDPTTACVSIFR